MSNLSFKCLINFIFFIIFQDVVYALAHATGKTGRFTLIERWRNNERLLAPQEHPLKVIIDYTSCFRFEAACYLILHTYMLIRNEKKQLFIRRNFNARKIRRINIEALNKKVTRVGSVTFCDHFIQKTYKISYENRIFANFDEAKS